MVAAVVAADSYTIMKMVNRKCYCLVLKPLKSRPIMLANKGKLDSGS